MAKLKKHFFDPDVSDRIFRWTTTFCAVLAILLIAGFVVQLFWHSIPAFKAFGLKFVFSSEWDPVRGIYGALPAIAGTLLTTLIAIFIAVPLSFIVAMFLVETAPPSISQPIGHAIDLLAAIPSIIYGLWGLFIFVPFMQEYIQPFLMDTLRLRAVPFFGGEYNGFGFLTAGIILALMIFPFICAIMRDVFRMTPAVLKEAAFGAGATRWEVTLDITMRYGAQGMFGAIFLGLGRAVGETMAVLFVIGNVPKLPSSLSQAGTTIAATLANNFAEADGILKSALFELGLILLLMALAVQIISQYWLSRIRRQMGDR
jgi:phosphate transport system permease protein